jgi:hypothetical protein
MNQHHETEFFLGSQQHFSWSKNSPHSMKHKGSLLYAQQPILNQINPIHILISYCYKIHFNIIPTPMPRSSKSFYPTVSPPQSSMHFSFLQYVPCAPTDFTLFFISWIIPNNKYKSLCCSLCSLLQSPVISSLLGPNIFLITLFSYTLGLSSSLNMTHQVSNPYEIMGQITGLCIFILMFLGRMQKTINSGLNASSRFLNWTCP